jgi:tetratricopeptide (TPR) repeat protein
LAAGGRFRHRIEGGEGLPGLPHADGDAIRARLSATRAGAGQDDAARLVTARALACANSWDVDGAHGAVRVRVHVKGSPADDNASTWYLREVEGRFEVVGAQNGTNMATLGRQALRALDERDVDEARVWLGWADAILRPTASAAEEYSLVSAWRTVEPARMAAARASDLPHLAAVLSAWNPRGAPEERVLRRELRRARSDARRGLRYALAAVLWSQGKRREPSKILAGLCKERPNDRGLLRWRILQHIRDRRFREALDQIDAYERRFPDDKKFAGPARAEARSGAGRYAEVQQETVARKRQAAADATDLNNVAWGALVHAGDLGTAAELAEESVRLEESVNALHTLATIYVELGNRDKAFQTLRKTVEKNGLGTDDSHIWYTLGRLAEDMGLEVSARDAYTRIRKPDHPDDRGTWALYERVARRRAGHHTDDRIGRRPR